MSLPIQELSQGTGPNPFMGQTSEIIGTMVFQPIKRRPQISKNKQNEKTEKHATDVGPW